MNCEKCQEMVSDLLDGSLNHQDEQILNRHLAECLDCAEVRQDIDSIVGFCRTHQGEYQAPPNEQALWLRIRNIVESELPVAATAAAIAAPRTGLAGWFNRSWELSLPQLAASVAAIAVFVSLSTIVAVRRSSTSAVAPATVVGNAFTGAKDVSSRMWQQQQAISYWNERVEMNKVRWSQEMRETFDRNLKVIDQAVNDSMSELDRNPHDEVSEEMLNAALNEKLALLKEFSDL